MSYLYVSVIGSSGKGMTMTHDLYKKMYTVMEASIKAVLDSQRLGWDRLCLVSGGCSLTDHLAVSLFLAHQTKLILHLPAKWTGTGFLDTGAKHWATNPGRVLNNHHSKFSKAVGIDSLKEIQASISQGAYVFDTYKGFHNRNTAVAQSPVIFAMTHSTGSAPTDGGTLDTWNKAQTQWKYHISLSNIVNPFST